MRLDRFISVNLAHPLSRAVRRLRMLAQPSPVVDGSLPILMYHGVSDDPEPGVSPYYQTNTSPAIFREQIEFLANQGYHSMNFDTVVKLIQDEKPLPGKTVAITFDDGFRNFHTEAFPVLQQHGFTASVFLPTSFIHNPRLTFKAKECLTWDEVRELRRCGIQFGSHTVTHPRLIELCWKEIEHELSASKQELEQQLGEPVTAFAHPYAFPQTEREYVRTFRNTLAGAGYTCCATTEIGRLKSGDDPYRMKRLPVNSMDDCALLCAKLEGAYDWLALPQAMTKQVKCRLPARFLRHRLN
ncbi:MAG: polysaccharide deacetylase family protein [Verrucomicrobiota bacterium]